MCFCEDENTKWPWELASSFKANQLKRYNPDMFQSVYHSSTVLLSKGSKTSLFSSMQHSLQECLTVFQNTTIFRTKNTYETQCIEKWNNAYGLRFNDGGLTAGSTVNFSIFFTKTCAFSNEWVKSS